MKRTNLLPGLNQKVRFEYAKIDNFSVEKSDDIFAGKIVFNPTILLINLSARLNYQIAKINHVWVNVTISLLKMNLHIGDTISFTARIMKYEKFNSDINLNVIDIGFNYIYNVNIISTEKNGKSLNDYLLECIYRNDMIIPDKYLNYAYKYILTEKNNKLIEKINKRKE